MLSLADAAGLRRVCSGWVDVQQHMVVIWVPLGVPGFVFRAGAVELVEIRRKIGAFGV